MIYTENKMGHIFIQLIQYFSVLSRNHLQRIQKMEQRQDLDFCLVQKLSCLIVALAMKKMSLTSPEDTQSTFKTKKKVYESEKMPMEYHLLSSSCLKISVGFIPYCLLIIGISIL